MYELLPSCWGTFRRPRFPPQLLGNVSHAAISSPAAGERFARRDFLPSCWGTFRRAWNPSPAAGERFQLRDSFPSRWGAFPAPGIFPQSLGSVSSSGNPSPAAGERFQLQESFPSSPPSIARAISRSAGVVSLIFSRLPSTRATGCPAASITEASSVKNGV